MLIHNCCFAVAIDLVDVAACAGIDAFIPRADVHCLCAQRRPARPAAGISYRVRICNQHSYFAERQ